MNSEIILQVEMTLLSDAIFSAGFSIPGGEDIAIYTDSDGYPYLKGSGFKGLLRESVQNILAWRGEENVTGELFGEEGWEGLALERRIRVTPFTLKKPLPEAKSCFYSRAFTEIKDGKAKDGSLRVASCIRRGLTFAGEIYCEAGDEELLREAVSGIKWAGSMRSRGFGRVKLQVVGTKTENSSAVSVGTAGCISYRMKTELPVIMTDLKRSKENSYDTKDYIPGSAVRGLIIGKLAAECPEWFEEHRAELLSDHVRFLNVLPDPNRMAVIPSIKGFYEDKTGGSFSSVVINGELKDGLKRAGMGTFCAIDGDTIRYWSGQTESIMRILRSPDGKTDSEPFTVSAISAGQEMQGYVITDDPVLAEKISEMLTSEIWIGADRFEGFGKCSITDVKAVDQPECYAACGYTGECSDTEIYMEALSPITMLSSDGVPCGLNTEKLAELLGVDSVKIRYCSTSVSEQGQYNRTWQCRAPAVQMYDSGSLFHLQCSEAPSAERLLAVQRSGLGIRRAEGFGQVLFIRREIIENPNLHKETVSEIKQNKYGSAAVTIRRARLNWIMENAEAVRKCGLSASQIGEIQAICESSDDFAALGQHLDKNEHDRGVKHGSKFKKIARFIEEADTRNLDDLISCPAAGTGTEKQKLQLLSALFDYSRKIGKEEN